MTQTTCTRPIGILQRIRASAASIFNRPAPSAAQPFEPDFIPRVIAQDLTVHLFATPVEPAKKITVTVTSQDVQFTEGFVYSAETQHSTDVKKFLSRAGRDGVTCDNVFYPHARIDRIDIGKVRAVEPGERTQSVSRDTIIH